MSSPATKELTTSSAFNEEDYECMLCLRLLFEPTTLKCGHSFCRTCCKSMFQQNHAKCPTCRKVLPVVHCYSSEVIVPSFTLCKLLETAFPEEYQQRRAEVLQLSSPPTSPSLLQDVNDNDAAADADAAAAASETTVLPLFYLDPMLPRQEMQLNIFEHRYLLMIARCLEGSQHFGMVGFLTRSMVVKLRRSRAASSSSSERNGSPISEDDDAMSMLYGVEVEIVESSPQPSGTIHIQVRAKRRFRIQGETWRQDGYTMANVQWLQLPTSSCTTVPAPPRDQGSGFIEDDQDEEQENSSTNGDTAVVDADTSETDTAEDTTSRIMEMAKALEPLVEEWKALVITEGWQRYHGQLAQTINNIGPMPEARDLAGAVDRALWVGALINPLPGMGVAPEIRHSILEKAAATDGNFLPLLNVVTHAIRKSIEYLTPNAIVRWIQYQLKITFCLITGQGTNHLGQPPPLPGTHQLVNALLRLMVVCLVLGFFWQRILTPKSSIVMAAMRNNNDSEL
jgi:Lon protease-like protein